MRYAEISKQRQAAAAKQPQPAQQKKREVVRFKVGTIYKIGGDRFVCVDRYTDTKGTHVGMVSLTELREEKKDEYGDIDYQEHRKGGFACHDEYIVRTDDGVEYAVGEENLSLIDGEKDANGDRYEIDGEEDLERVRDVAETRADKTYGVESLEREEKEVRPKKKRRSKKGNPIAGLVVIVFIILLIRACSGI